MKNIKFSEFDYLYGKGDLTNSTDFCFLGIPAGDDEFGSSIQGFLFDRDYNSIYLIFI